MRTRDVVAEAIHLTRLDAARWIRPETIAPVGDVTPMVVVRLAARHLPLRAMIWFRLAAAASRLGVRGLPGLVQRHLLTRFGLEISPAATVGGGLYIAHPVGCVLHAESIGSNVTVIGSATFGTRDDDRWPTIGDRVFVGIGARVLGGVTVGDDARIGSNAVVLDDVPASAVAVGVPARLISSD